MKEICNNCIHADYTEGQKGWAENNKTSLVNQTRKYCYGRGHGYVEKGHTCKDFLLKQNTS